MAQTIAQSLEILNETMTNSKTALQDKGVSVEDTYKLSDVDEKIAEIQAGGSGGNEVDVSSNDWHALTIGKNSLIIMTDYNGDAVPNFFIQSGPHPVAETTLIYKPCTYIYIGLFDNSDQKVEIGSHVEYEEAGGSSTYSGLIDISTPKVFVVKKNNYSSGQEPQK